MDIIEEIALDEINISAVHNQYLLFLVGGDLYAVEALCAKEIVEYSHITKVPMLNTFVKGVTNIRGNIVPVIDLLDRFSFGQTEIQAKTSIVVINHYDGDETIQIGIIIDEVYEVDNIDVESTINAPEFGSKIDKRFIGKMGKYNGEYIPILSTEFILDTEELSKITG